MASSNIETWEFRPSFDNSWMSESFTRETEVITQALTHSITNVSDNRNVSYLQTPSFPVHSVSSSGTSEQDQEPETPSVSKRPPRNPLSRKITKRKSRASKRSTTTFINADPENFRQMVQQVTGHQFGSGSGPVLKPEPYRVGFGSSVVSKFQGAGNGGYLLPTLDTSAFLLDHHQQVVGPINGATGPGFGPSSGEASGLGYDFDGLSCFPTLESWKVM